MGGWGLHALCMQTHAPCKQRHAVEAAAAHLICSADRPPDPARMPRTAASPPRWNAASRSAHSTASFAAASATSAAPSGGTCCAASLQKGASASPRGGAARNIESGKLTAASTPLLRKETPTCVQWAGAVRQHAGRCMAAMRRRAGRMRCGMRQGLHLRPWAPAPSPSCHQGR